MTTTNTEFGDRYRTARESAGLTQGQAAKLLGLHRPSISEMEAGRRKVSADELLQLARIYGVDIAWLAGETNSESEPKERLLKLAARELATLNQEDLEKLLGVINMIRNDSD